jgi:type VI secretion system protein ImpA
VEVLPFAKLLAAVPGDKPAGVDLRRESTGLFHRAKDARNKASTQESRIESLPPDKAKDEALPDWRPVLEDAVKALSEQTKDLQITTFLIEALVRLHGLAGLRDGLRLARELADKFWDGLYPMPDPDEPPSVRISHLVGLNGSGGGGPLVVPILRVQVTAPGGSPEHTVLQYEGGAALQKISDAKARETKIAAGTIPMEALKQAAAETKPEFYQALLADVAACQENLKQLAAALDKRCKSAGGDPFPTGAIREALGRCESAIKALAPPLPVAAAAAAAPTGTGAPAAAAAPGEIRTREDALTVLGRVADFFRKTEPHSFVTSTLDQAVRWGKTQLPELLTELIPDQAQRATLFKLVGIRPAEPPKK